MRSGSAAAINERLTARVATMTPAARMALAVRLGEEALAALMAAHDLVRATAIARIQARAGSDDVTRRRRIRMHLEPVRSVLEARAPDAGHPR